MIPLERLLETFRALERSELERWIAEDLVRPERSGEELLFGDIDLARVRLLLELRHDLRLDEEALPVVVSLMDQLYAARRRMRLLCEAIDRAGSELQQAVIGELRRRLEAGEA
jgi:chaperone modulatory protein CbpM